MSEKPLPTLPEVLELSTGVVLSSGSLILAAHLAPGSREQALALWAVYGNLVNTTIGRAARWMFSERIVPFMQSFGRHYGTADPVEAQAKFEEAAKANESNGTFHQTVYESFRRMMDAVDQSVVPALGSLAGLYTSQDKKPDGFFRGLGRLLCDLEAGELEQLKRILLLAQEGFRSGPEVGISIDHNGQLVAFARGRLVYEPKVIPDAVRLFMLLKREGLGGSVASDGAVAGAQPRQPDRELSLDAITTPKVMAILEPLGTPNGERHDYFTRPEAEESAPPESD